MSKYNYTRIQPKIETQNKITKTTVISKPQSEIIGSEQKQNQNTLENSRLQVNGEINFTSFFFAREKGKTEKQKI